MLLPHAIDYGRRFFDHFSQPRATQRIDYDAAD